jgi:hypothetical protein
LAKAVASLGAVDDRIGALRIAARFFDRSEQTKAFKLASVRVIHHYGTQKRDLAKCSQAVTGAIARFVVTSGFGHILVPSLFASITIADLPPVFPQLALETKGLYVGGSNKVQSFNRVRPRPIARQA